MAESEEKKEIDENISTKSDDTEQLKKSISEINDKYVRLYAEFENYKRFAAKNKEEQFKYANEHLIKDLLTVIDHLELALQHSAHNEASSHLTEGVQLILKELRTVLERYGLTGIEALGKPFDPAVHHAISQIESEEAEENTVINELRKGYMFKDRVIRAALVGVAKKPSLADSVESSNIQNKP